MNQRAILIVDDEKNIRLTLSQALETMDVEVDTAVNGEDALTKIGSPGLQVILLDLKMPGMDGIEVLRHVAEVRPDVRVIILTAHGTVCSAVEAMKLGAVDFVQKPFSPKEIRELVQTVLNRNAIEAAQTNDYHSHIELSKRCINGRQFDAAREHVRRAIAADPGKAEAFNLLGALSEIMGENTEARKHYRVAYALDPTYKPAQENLSRLSMLPPSSAHIALGKNEKL